MSNYTQITQFTPKDSLPSGNAAKVIRGADFDPEFSAISTAIATKYDSTLIAAGPVPFGNGTVGNPAIYFGTATTTGFYAPAANQVGVTISGVNLVTWASSGVTYAKNLTISSGGLTVSAGTTAVQAFTATTINGQALTLAGSFTTAGAFALTLTTAASTNVTLPTSGTLATTSQLPTAANPTGTVGLSTVNGSAATFLRSDGAPPLSQAITPTWSAAHNFTGGLNISGVPVSQVPLTVTTKSGAYTLAQSDTGSVLEFTASATLTVNTGLNVGTTVVVIANSGVTVTISQGAGFTLNWANGGSSTGSRTLTGIGQCSIIIDGSGTSGYILGGGLS